MTQDKPDKCDDKKVMQLWRKAGLPEYFLGNGGTNQKLVKFSELVRADNNAQETAPAEQDALKSALDERSEKNQKALTEVARKHTTQADNVARDEALAVLRKDWATIEQPGGVFKIDYVGFTNAVALHIDTIEAALQSRPSVDVGKMVENEND